MSRWGTADYSQLKALAKAFEKLSGPEMDKLCVECSKALAARLLALVIPATPVGSYRKGSGKKGGTLRRGWTAKTHEEATGGSGKQAKEYADSLTVAKSGNSYTIEIINPVKYASYVEYGHRTVNGGWVEGRYMLTISEEKLKRVTPSVLEKMVLKKLSEVCDVGN